MKINVKHFLHNLSTVSFLLYMITLYTFVDHPILYRYSQIAFLFFATSALLEVFSNRKIYLNNSTIYFLVLPFMFLVSYFWAQDKTNVIKNSITIAQISILCILVYHVYMNEDNFEKLINVFLISGLFMCTYSLIIYTPNQILNSMLYGTRLGSLISQENTFGMNAAYTAILCFYKAQKKSKLWYFIFFLPFILSMTSGSKKALIIIILGIVILTYFEYGFRKLFKFIITTSIMLFIMWTILQLPYFQLINQRTLDFISIFNGSSQIDGSTELRRDFTIFGFQKFFQKPFFGYGTGNFAYYNTVKIGYYSHNNFVELLVNNGIFGFLIYYYSYFFLIKKFFILTFRKDRVAYILFTIIVISLVTQIALVVYYDKLQYIILAICFAYYKKINLKQKQFVRS